MIRYSASPDHDFIKSNNPVGVDKVEFDSVFSTGSFQSIIVDDVAMKSGDASIVDKNWAFCTRSLISGNFSTATSGIATLSSAGELSRVSDGTSVIDIRLENGETYKLSLPVSRLSGQTTKTFISWEDGSLAAHIFDDIKDHINGKTQSQANSIIFVIDEHNLEAYPRNTNLWYEEFFIHSSCFDFWQSDYKFGEGRPQTAITKRHIIGSSDHFDPISISGEHRFVGQDGSTIERFVTHSKKISGTNIQISLLNRDLPAFIKPINILPTGIDVYLPRPEFGIPCLAKTYSGDLKLDEINAINNTSISFSPKNVGSNTEWRSQLLEEDSGAPCFFIINNKPVLVSLRQNWLSGEALHEIDWATEIETLDALASIDTGYTPAVIDLSGFNQY